MNRRELIAGAAAAGTVGAHADTVTTTRKCCGFLVCKPHELEAAKELAAKGARAMIPAGAKFEIIVKPIVSADMVLVENDGSRACFRTSAKGVWPESLCVMWSDLIDCYTVAWSYRAPRGFHGDFGELKPMHEFLEVESR